MEDSATKKWKLIPMKKKGTGSVMGEFDPTLTTTANLSTRGLNDEQLDFIDECAAAVVQWSPKSLGGTQYAFEDVLTDSMVTQVNASITWQQTSCEVLSQKFGQPMPGRSMPWCRKLTAALMRVDYLKKELNASGYKLEDYVKFLSFIVAKFWSKEFHELMVLYMSQDNPSAGEIVKKIKDALAFKTSTKKGNGGNSEREKNIRDEYAPKWPLDTGKRDLGHTEGDSSELAELENIVRAHVNPGFGSW